MKPNKVLFLLIGIGALAYILLRMDVNISEVIKSVKYFQYVVLAAFVITVLPLINALRMKYMVYSIEGKMPSMHDLAVIEYVYKFISNVMPFKLNIPAKVVLLNKKCGIKLSNSASVVSFEYALDSSIIILFGFLGALAYFRNDTRISFTSIEYFIIITLLCGVVFFCIPTDYFGKLLTHAEKISVKIIHVIAVFGFKLLWAIRGTWTKLILQREMIKVLIATAIIWLTAIFANELLFLSTGVYVPPTWIIVSMCSGIFIGGISTIPGGIGIREATMVLVYDYLGILNEASITAVLLSRLLSMIPLLIGYIYSAKTGYDKITQSKMDIPDEK